MRYFIILIVAFVLLSGCGQAQNPVSSTATLVPPTPLLSATAIPTLNPPTSSVTPAPTTQTPSPTATLSPRPLIVCAQRPPALNPFTPSRASYDVLGFLSVFPVEQRLHQWEPRLVTHIPSFENGDVMTRSVSVPYGEFFVDSQGVVQVHNGGNPLTLPQLVVTYTLKSDLKWSDAHPLTTKDVAFSFSLGNDPLAFGFWQNLAEHTAELTIIDDQRIQWVGRPGFISTNYPGFLFPPQPEHKWGESNLSEILQDRNPPVTGPYRIADWEDDTSITLEVNPYFSGKQPVVKKVILRFPEVNPVFWAELYRVGSCDILFPGDIANYSWLTWLKLVKEGHAVMWNTPSLTLLRLDFNISTSSLRTIPLRETRTRFGLAHCISREHLRELPVGDAFEPAVSFIPAEHPAYDPSAVWRVPFNIEIGQGILDEVGWIDEDGDGIREAHNVEDIKENTPLTLTLSTSTRDVAAAEIIAADFRNCGVGITIKALGPQQLFAASSVSPLYSGDFHLALYSWDTQVPEGCSAWLSDRLPDNGIHGIEYNYGRFSNPLYDEACQKALKAVDLDVQSQALHAVQAILSEEQPTLFLVWQPLWLITRPEISNVIPDVTTVGSLYHLENIDFDTR